MRWRRESEEEHLPLDERLNEVGWDIYFGATRAMGEREAAALALDGTFRDRVRVRDDLLRRRRIALEQRYEELHPAGLASELPSRPHRSGPSAGHGGPVSERP